MSSVLTDYQPSYGKDSRKNQSHKIDYIHSANPNQATPEQLSNFVFGKKQPHSPELEALTLGACLIDSDSYPKIKELLSSEDFYITEHRTIYKAIEDLQNRPSPIAVDLGTVSNHLHETKQMDIVGGAYALIELTNRVASGANVEYHARIVKQKSYHRKLIDNASWAIGQAYDESNDIFDLYEKFQDRLSIQSLNPVFMGGNAEKIMKLAQAAPEIKTMFGNFFKTGDLSLFFAPKKTGKTVLGYQIADAIAKGEGMFDNLVPNEAGEQTVLYCDLELNLADFKERYENPQSKKMYGFSKNLNIQMLNPTNFSFEQGKMLREIEKLIIENKPKVLIIDNLTALMKSISDADSALIAIRSLLSLKHRYNLSILVMCHTPKKVGNSPLLSDDILGSGILLNLATSIFGIRRSFQDKSIVYLKHCDTRNKTTIFDEDNVIQMRIEKVDNFVSFHFEGCGKEANHLIKKGDEAETETFDIAIQAYTEGKSWAKVKDQIGYSYSAQALQKACIKYAERSQAYVYIAAQQRFVPWLEADAITPEIPENTEGGVLADVTPNVITKTAAMNGENAETPF